MDGIPEELQTLSSAMRPKAERIISLHEDGVDIDNHQEAQALLKEVNAACEQMNQ